MKLKTLIIAMLILGLLAACNASPTIVSTANVTNVPKETSKSQGGVMGTPDPARDKVIITSVKKDETGLETITVTNISTETQDITGYFLYLSSTTERIKFPKVVLKAGESYKIYNGPGAKDKTDGLYWRDEPVWQVQGDDVTLLNTAGRLIWVAVYYP